MTDERIIEIAEEHTPYDLTLEEKEFCLNFARALLAACASEGQTFEAWLKGPHDGNFNDQNHPLTPSERVAASRAWRARDAELTALRERVAGIRMEALKEARHVVYMALSLNDAFKSIEALVDKEKA